ncbi:MAG: HEAT repeat domain-containing protein [Tepidisphaeraceae bacterium]
MTVRNTLRTIGWCAWTTTVVCPTILIAQPVSQGAAAVLNDPQASQAQRDEAARRLLTTQASQGRQVLANALLDQSNPGAQLAAARALAEDQQPDPSLINPLFAALGARRDLTDAAARALAGYHATPEVLTRLIRIAESNPRAPDAVRPDVRVAAIRAMGAFVEKRCAAALVMILRSADEPPAVRNAAADALAMLASESESGPDPDTWDRWWEANSRKSDADFRNELLLRKAGQLDQLQSHVNQFAAEVAIILREQYQSASDAQKEPQLLRYLQSPEPAIRQVGSQIVYENAIGARAIPQSAREQLRLMIADSSAPVRRSAVDALHALNDADALDPLLAQLAIEPDPSVRAAIATALGPINDVKAAPALLKLLDDPSRAVQRASAIALRDLGPRLYEQDPRLAREIALALRRLVDSTTNQAMLVELRAACVEALAPLKQADLAPVYFKLLSNRAEAPRVRIAALRAVGELGDRTAADVVVTQLDDADPAVRQAAVRALGEITASDHAEALRLLLDENSERDAGVRDAAWQVLVGFFPHMPKEQLVIWEDRVRNDPQREITVSKVLVDKLQAARELDALATAQFQIADAYRALEQPEQAAPYYKLSLDYRMSTGATGMTIVSLVDGYMWALLRGQKYADATAFAEQSLRQDPSNQQMIGPAIKSEVDRLAQSDRAEDLQNARALIELTEKMNPALATQYMDQLRDAEKQIRKRLNGASGSDSGPRSAKAPATQPAPSAMGG